MGSASASIKLTGIDWSEQKRVQMDGGVPSDTTVGEVLSEMVRAMQLPATTPYAAYYQGRKLNRADTIESAGLENEAEIVLSPEVTAGG